MFTAKNMERITQLPLYKGRKSDLPANSLVTVGYAVNEYVYTAKTQHKGLPVASFNILFVICIGDVDRTMLDEISIALEENK